MLFDLIRACRRFLGRVTGREAKRLKTRIGALRVELATSQDSAMNLDALYQEAIEKIQ
jgi:hypothetical protein